MKWKFDLIWKISVTTKFNFIDKKNHIIKKEREEYTKIKGFFFSFPKKYVSEIFSAN